MIRFRGRHELDRVAGALRGTPAYLRRQLVGELKAAARPAVRDIQQAIRTADVSGRRVTGKRYRVRRDGTRVEVPIRRFLERIPSRGLRGPMARAVDSQVSTVEGQVRVDIVLKRERVPLRIRRTVKYVAGDSERWRHPIMGKNRDGSWRGGVSQNAPNVFWPTAKKHLPRFNKAVAAAVDAAEQRIREVT